MKSYEVITETAANIEVSSPHGMSSQQPTTIAEFIARGGEVSLANALSGVQRTKLLGYALDERGDIIAVTAMKSPLDTYKVKVFTAAGYPDLVNQYQYEIGYSYTDTNHRRQGLAKAISQQLLSSVGGNIFATTRSDNVPSKNSLSSQGLSQLGKSWTSMRGDYSLELWVNK